MTNYNKARNQSAASYSQMKSAQGIMMKIAGILTLPLILLSCTPESIDPDIPFSSNWDTYLGDNARTHYSPLTQITRQNVEQLELAWSYDSGE